MPFFAACYQHTLHSRPMTTPLFPSSSTDSAPSTVGRVAAGVAGVLFALVILAAPLSAQPTSSADLGPSTWETHYGEQAALMLRSDNERKRSRTLQTLIRITAEGRAVDLSAAAPALFEVYENDSSLEHRIMAATALQRAAGRSTGGDQIMRHLGTLVTEQSSERVQRLTLLMLAGYETERGRVLRVSPVLYDLVTGSGQA